MSHAHSPNVVHAIFMLVLDAEQSAERALEFAYQPDLLQIAVSCMLFTDRLSTNSANCIALLPAASSVLFTMLFWNPACIAGCAKCSCTCTCVVST